MKDETIPAATLRQMLKIFAMRYEQNFFIKPTKLKLKEHSKKLLKSFLENKLQFKVSKKGQLIYFFMFDQTFMGEFQEHFFHVTSFYCVADKRERNSLYKAMKLAALEMKESNGIKKMAIEVSCEDQAGRIHYAKLGKLTYVLMIGNTKRSLSILKKDESPTKVKISLAKKDEIPKLIKLDMQSHLNDKTSRMHDLYKTMPKANFMSFYKKLLQNKSLLVAREGKDLLGSIGYFEDKKNSQGLIAMIFVANKHKGRGVSKLLYKRVLHDFSIKKLKYYVGGSTTKSVLALAKKLERVESRYAYLLKV